MPHEFLPQRAISCGHRRTGPGQVACSMCCCPASISACRLSPGASRSSMPRRAFADRAHGHPQHLCAANRPAHAQGGAGYPEAVSPQSAQCRLRRRGAGRGHLRLGQGGAGLTINEFYGQTECNLVLASCAAIGISKAGYIGKSVPGHTVAVIRDDGMACAPDEEGQIAILRPDPVMFLGYWNNDAATPARSSSATG